MAADAIGTALTVIDLCRSIYAITEECRNYKKKCNELQQRVRGIEGPIVELQKREDLDKNLFQAPLNKLADTLREASAFVEKLQGMSNFQRVRKANSLKAKFEEFHQRLSDANHDLDVALDIDTNVRMQRIHDLHVNMKAQQEFSELVYVDFRENSLATDTLAGEEKTEMEDRVGRCQSANSRSDGTKRESYGTDAATAARGSTYPQTSRRSTGNACVDDCNCTVCLCCLKIRFKPKCCC